MEINKIRTGFGYDVHKFSTGRKLILGGVEIPHLTGLSGHSDADVLLHAICDSLLGAAGFDDIGHQFPNTNPEFKNVSSLVLLGKCYKLLKSKKWKIANIDAMVILEEPKINRYIPEMKKRISSIIKTENISIKATTSEGIGFVGKKQGCQAYSTCLIYK
ncbi:MAG: 2-C-methyl-D-erythritol 2,4-cyclodiphosphate synthase [Ignavibacteriaceae bacterium]|jgi:2C-methyl-D-erythritol 2,4-cyclodiphosphate synthase|nr:MAG: 2-C-methyl-D-erythritol 2,4-cyclodiphosphate synthase [Chlorobiota bacterium]KXK02514.1 MAG: 2C-methyl-D-erythritol 2,4-cyclodiphosphate synthase [Chlorobi bacterium OLB4]MBV6398108.1 2-C-methyl-D-erythritol 2,4-cyclodiphosphate synthase [Ignavibacteria bacterium]MCC6886557.1 2-C-methyl-D-erythritol 2,4-cyclodiphosphate synthase [Ignavibacteriales bacterium]MCE7952367.1 2-C-methyl-D-erythritol 2,4-cyclodiphosphate synthase [Chlorobi bacterium CHB7]MDL1886484.1 2-C-methyl-D-erythritol 2